MGSYVLSSGFYDAYYKKASAVRELIRDDFKKAFKRLTEGNKADFETIFQYSEQDGDDLLIQIFEAIKREFLTNVDYGLDAYLSMRIRHGSLSGHLRSPLDEQGLIVSKDENGKYKENKAISERLGTLAETEVDNINQTFRNFSVRYDDIIEDIHAHRAAVSDRFGVIHSFLVTKKVHVVAVIVLTS